MLSHRWLQPFYNLVNFIGCNDNVSLHVYVYKSSRYKINVHVHNNIVSLLS